MENVLSLQNSHQSILQGLSNVVNITFQIDRLLGQLPAIHWTKPVREIAIKLMNVCQSTIIDGLHRLIKLKTIFPLFQVSALSRRNNSLNLYTVVHRRYILPNLPLKTCYLLPIAMVVTINNFSTVRMVQILKRFAAILFVMCLKLFYLKRFEVFAPLVENIGLN